MIFTEAMILAGNPVWYYEMMILKYVKGVRKVRAEERAK
jgi:hypothetical protein